ncbi:MAG: type IV pilus assembly protein PilM [Candidatus Moranbacteria bacterium]|nr:type IV pilus assembly protein PilM [Candidatus Moranbacteria bacterium]
MNFFTHNLFSSKYRAFGLEIKSSSIKAAWLKKKKNKFRLMACGRKIPSRENVQSDRVINPQKLAEEIRYLLESAQPKPIKIKNAIVSIPEARAFIRTIQIPKMSYNEAKEAVKWETEANIPISVDRVYIDWQVISTNVDKEDVLVAAVPKDVVDSYFETVRLAGLSPLVMEIDAIATIRSLTRNINTEAPVLIADIGAGSTSFAICQNQIPYFTSSIPLSGDSFTEVLQKELGVGWEKAEEIKFQFGAGKENTNDVHDKLLDPLIENLAAEIEKSIIFYSESICKVEKVQKVILSGGGALLHGLPKKLEERLKIEVVMGDPAYQIDTKSFPYEVSPRDLLSYSTVLGLALREINYGR